MRNPALWTALMMAALALSGCTSGNDGPGDDPAETNDDMVDEDVLTAESVVDAPEWAIGDWFGHHIFFGSSDTSGTHIDAVIVDESGGDWILVANDRGAAKWEAAWDFPMLGTISKDDLATTAFSADWNLYDFPLSDGKTWTSTFNPLFSGARELTMTATFDERIQTPGQGFKAGFRIEGINENGEVELITDYIPEIRWYSELIYYDRLFNPGTEEFVIEVRAMGQGTEWSGTTIVAEADPQVAHFPCFAPLNQDGTPNQACLAPQTFIGFQVDEGVDELYGLVILGAVAAEARVDIGSPNGVQSFEAQSLAIDDFQFLFEFVENENPTAGQWSYNWLGAGFVSFGGTQLWLIEYTETAFP